MQSAEPAVVVRGREKPAILSCFSPYAFLLVYLIPLLVSNHHRGRYYHQPLSLYWGSCQPGREIGSTLGKCLGFVSGGCNCLCQERDRIPLASLPIETSVRFSSLASLREGLLLALDRKEVKAVCLHSRVSLGPSRGHCPT